MSAPDQFALLLNENSTVSNIRVLEWRSSATQSAIEAAFAFMQKFIDVWISNHGSFSVAARRRFLVAYGRECITATDFAKDDFDFESTQRSVKAGAEILRAAGKNQSATDTSKISDMEMRWICRLLK